MRKIIKHGGKYVKNGEFQQWIGIYKRKLE
jgi:hypothetical protein